ncbi:MerR family transcriptional regulator [Mycolicibacterium septicum]|uniref:MerR family transcriptional regulator n=1 Tax=Mycolicibacterium septicum TaxID=98668 RepID=UPI003D33B232
MWTKLGRRERWDVQGDALRRSARGVYGISVAAELSGIDPQTLRLYERRGLLTPARTDGGTRRYSDDDLDRLQRIADLVADGVNIAGIAQILPLQDRNAELASTNGELTSENARLRSQKPRSGRR